MNKFLALGLILFFSSCQIFNIKRPAHENQVNNMVIYANIQTGSAFLNELKLKTKINISIDSMSITAYPIMGLNLGTIVVKDHMILINQKLTNTRDSIIINNSLALRTQSLWRMENDFMGGIYHAYYFNNNFQPIIIYTYLYAPSERKGVFLLQLESIINTSSF